MCAHGLLEKLHFQENGVFEGVLHFSNKEVHIIAKPNIPLDSSRCGLFAGYFYLANGQWYREILAAFGLQVPED